jgi:ribose 5-phosphate isomerase A
MLPRMSPSVRGEMLEKEKQSAARAALRWVRSGMTVGLGSGSTMRYFIELLGKRLRDDRLAIEAVASSTVSEARARDAGIRVIMPRRGLRLDLTVDGADEIAPDLSLIKGRGGALLREKVLAQASRHFLVIADSSKRVDRLGARPVPVEVVPFALPWVIDQVEAMGAEAIPLMDRSSPAEPFLTDQQNYILDCRFGDLKDPQAVGEQLERIPGVVEHGLFVDYAHAALVAEGTGVWILRRGQPPAPLTGSDVPVES